MIIAVLALLGLVFGSFVNALVWRLHAQEQVKNKKVKVKKSTDLSILKGRSVCPHCEHELAAKDLIPVISWLSLVGRCRYCKKPISWQYPLVELATALLFVFSYAFWPAAFNGQGTTLFVFWLVFLAGFMALLVYDLKWYTLPNKLVYPLLASAVVQVFAMLIFFHGGSALLRSTVFGVLIGGGLFYLLFQVSSGKWIGGGDVKLGTILGILVGGPETAFLFLFLASLLGTLWALPLMVQGKANRQTRLPFGPFLIASAIIVYLFGASIITWYKHKVLLYP